MTTTSHSCESESKESVGHKHPPGPTVRADRAGKASMLNQVDTFDSAWKVMQASGLKRTANREHLLRFMIEHHGPFSKDEIKRALPGGDDFDSVTLYRNLSTLEEIGLLRRSEFGDGVSRYEFQSDPTHHHHHVVCTVCRKVDSLDECALPNLDAIVAKMGYSKVRHSLEFFGVCGECG